MHVAEVLADLIAEQDALDQVVARLEPAQWALATPSARWTVADQIAHLAYFDAAAVHAITDPQTFGSEVARIAAAAVNGDVAVDEATLTDFRLLEPHELLEKWRANRRALAAAGSELTDDVRVAWYGPPMGSKSFLTARLMETWAHGQDIIDAVGAIRPPTARLRHIAQLGFITREWTYINRGLAVPQATIRLELIGPGGEQWTWGPEDGDEVVRGGAEEFCLVVTQRRHLDDTAIETGPMGRDWLLKAQAFAGPATDGPAPRSV